MTKPDDRDRTGPRGQAGQGAARTAAACPICGKPAAPATQPFCSKRCAQLDLGRWLTGSYRVPTDEPADPSDLPREDEE